MSMPAVTPDLAPYLERVFLFDAVEDSYEITDCTGAIPTWLRGTYYVNGPARFERSGLRYKHWLDGDGMVCAVNFGNDAIRFTNRFVQTTKLRDENECGRAVYRGFGTRFPGDKLRRGLMLEPPNNVSAYCYAGTLLAFGEQAIPYALDPVTLETKSEYDFNGRLTEVTPFAAHPKIDVETGHLVNFGISFSPTEPMLNLYEFDGAGNLLRRRRHPLKYQHSNHDFAVSAHYAAFFLSPLIMDFSKFWGEHLSVMESLTWEPEKGSRILMVPRESKSERAFEVEAGHGYALHLINCFEQDGRIMVDAMELVAPAYCEYETLPDVFGTVTPCRPVRYVIDPGSKSLIERISMAYDRSPDFPATFRHDAGKPYDDFWILGISASGKPGRKFFDQLAHGNWKRGAVDDVYQVSPGQYLGGEPLPVCDPADPEDAVVISEFFDAERERCEILLFEAAHVAKGPIARLGLRNKIHLGFHTSFQPA